MQGMDGRVCDCTLKLWNCGRAAVEASLSALAIGKCRSAETMKPLASENLHG